MLGDELRPATDHHLIHVALHQHVAVPVGHRYRVVVGPVADQRQRTHSASLLVAGVVGCRRQGQQGLQVPLHPLPNSLCMAAELGVHPLQAAPLQVGVERVKALEGRHGHQEIAPRVAHQSLHLSFAVALAGTPEPVAEQIVGLEFGEGTGALAPAVAQYLRHRQLGIVVEDALGHSPQESKG